MDRARGRTSGGVSAPRRPRTTGFKDSPVHDEDDLVDEGHNSRLRERIKKDGSVPGTSLRNKRKRQEAPVQTPDEADESSDDLDGGATDDDDDPPPPPPPPPSIPRWPGKQRPSSSSSKFAEEGIGLDLAAAVPRKARSAIKRHHESPQAGANASTPPQQQQQQQTPSSSAPSASTYNNAAGKPGRRMKPNGSKARPSKVPKSSAAPISDQEEAEIAAVLFDLARRPVHQKTDSRSETRIESRLEKSSIRVSSAAVPEQPAGAPHTNVLPPGSSSHPAEAPRRKRPRQRPRPDEGGPSRVSKGELDRSSTERKIENSSKLLSSTSAGPSTPANVGSSVQTFSEPCDASAQRSENAADARPGVADTVNADLNKRRIPSGDNRPVKLDIDLMALPALSLNNDAAECTADLNRKDEHEDIQGSTTELYWLDKERDRIKEKDKDQQEEIDDKKNVEAPMKDDRECLDLNKQGMAGLRSSSKGLKLDAKNSQKPDRSVSAAVVSAASSFLNANATTSGCSTTPAWPGGYYAPPLAAVAAVAAQAATEEPNIARPQTWKRCGIHLFIARFIDFQQQLARSTFMAATLSYGAKPYNLNIPPDAVFGNAAGASASNAAGSNVSSGLALGAISERNAQKSAPYMEAMFRKHPAQQQQQVPAFGFPVSQTMGTNASASAGSTGLLSASTGAGGSSAAGTGNNTVASMAAQAQFFQAVMQHNAFPFPFPTTPFASHNFNGAQNLGQQAAQFVNNPFYASHMVQQGQAGSNVLSGSSQKPQPGGRLFTGLGSAQQMSSYAPSSQQNLSGALQGDKDGVVREGDNKMLQRLMFGQQPAGNGGPNLNAPPVLGTEDYVKHAGKSSVLQQVQGAGQLSQHGMQMSLNSQQTSQASGTTTSNRGVGPGPLGLAPVAAVMAPQGHAVLQGMADQGRLQQHPHGQSQSHMHAMQPGGGQQQPRSMRVEEIYEGNNNSDDRKSSKRGPVSRVDVDALPNTMQASASPNSSSRIGNAAMNLLPAGAASSRLQAGAGSPVQSANQNVKQPSVRAKAPLSSASPQPATSFVDRSVMSRGGSAPGLSFPPQGGLPSMQATKQNQVPVTTQQQQSQMKASSQRPSVTSGLSGTSGIGVNLPKSQAQQPVRSPQSSSPAPRMNSAPASSSVSMSQAPKQASMNQKNATKGGGAFSLSQKPAGVAIPGKRPATPNNTSPMQNPNSTTPGKQQQQQLTQSSSPQHLSAQQQQQQQQQYQPHQLVNQMHKQSLPRQSQMFLQQQYLQQGLMPQGLVQQQQHPSHSSGSPSANGLTLGSQGLSLGSNSNGAQKTQVAMDSSSFSQGGMMTKSAPSRTPSGSPATSTSQRVNGTTSTMPGLHQTGSPNSIQQQQQQQQQLSSPFPAAGYATAVSAVKSSEQKNEASQEPSSMKASGFSSQAPGRQQQLQQQGGKAGSGNFTQQQQHQQQQQQQQHQHQHQQQQQQQQLALPSLSPIAASSAGAPGLLGQSSASALRP